MIMSMQSTKNEFANHIDSEAIPPKFTTFALISFCLAIILPQGIGIRFSSYLPHIDLPRIFIVSILILGGVLFLVGRWRRCAQEAPVSCSILIVMAIWFLITACLSTSPKASILFVLRVLMIGPLYAIAFCALADKTSHNNERYFFWILLTTGILIFIASFEFISQTYLIPSSLRTSFYDNSFYRRVIECLQRRGNGILSRGPYVSQHDFGGVLCVFSGFAWWILENRKKFGIIFAAMYIIAIYAVGTRSVTIAVVLSMVTWLISRKSIKNAKRLLLVLLIAAIVITLKLSPARARTGFFLTSDITNMEQLTPEKQKIDSAKAAEITEKLSLSLLPHEPSEKFFYNTGTIGIRLTGALINIDRAKHWWLFGYGPGAFLMADKVASVAAQYGDPGLLLAFMFESGLFMAALFGVLIIRSLWLGLRNTESGAWAPALGVLAWTVFSLSSGALWPMLPALVMTVLVEIWSNKHTHKIIPHSGK